MPWKWNIVTPPATQPITYQQAARHLRLPDMEDQEYVNDAIADAIDAVQNEIDGSLVTQTLAVTHFDYSAQYFYLPRGPVQSISAVTANGLTIASTLYALEAAGTYDYLYSKILLSPPIVITYVAGYTAIPNDLRRALLVQLSQFYEFRESQSPKTLTMVSNGLERIYDKRRRGPKVM
jgi:uncharacterized phiE125 gp8 family phage protein